MTATGGVARRAPGDSDQDAERSKRMAKVDVLRCRQEPAR